MLTCKEENFLQRFVDGVPSFAFHWNALSDPARSIYRDLFTAIKKEVLEKVKLEKENWENEQGESERLIRKEALVEGAEDGFEKGWNQALESMIESAKAEKK